jgi:hypothetical protein
VASAPAAGDGSGSLSGTIEPEEARRTLNTLARHRTRIDRDLRLAEQALQTAQNGRPGKPAVLATANAARLRWLAERMDDPVASDAGMIEPEGRPPSRR